MLFANRVLPCTLSVITPLTAQSLPVSLFLISELSCTFCSSYPCYQCLPEALWLCWCAHYLCSSEQLLIAPCNCQIQCSEITWISCETLLKNHSICCLLFLCCWQRSVPQIAHLSGAVFSEEPQCEPCQDEPCIYKSMSSSEFAPGAACPGSCRAPGFSTEMVLRLPQQVQQGSTVVFIILGLPLPTAALWFWSPVALRLPARLLGLFGKHCSIPSRGGGWRWKVFGGSGLRSDSRGWLFIL